MISSMVITTLCFAALILAACAGYSLWCAYAAHKQRQETMRRLRGDRSALGRYLSHDPYLLKQLSFYKAVLETLIRASRLGPLNNSAIVRSPLKQDQFFRLVEKSGLNGAITYEGFRNTQLRFALVGAAGGLLIGLVFSFELGCLLALGGFLIGFRLPSMAIEKLVRCRKEILERHLSEMLDVITLALRSGLSFDRAIDLYCHYFKGLLGGAFATAYNQWSCGIQPRDEALRSLADSFDSRMFHQVVETMIRSLRFGTSMASSLEDEAQDARQQYRAAKQELVAKAPVKMMMPTGALILPAMLLLVMGPVLLELVEGF